MAILITGASGQDGLILLSRLSKMLEPVVAAVGSVGNVSKVQLFAPSALVEVGKLEDTAFVRYLFAKYTFSRIFNFAALSSVGASWKSPAESIFSNSVSVINLLEALRESQDNGQRTQLYQASSAEMYSKSEVRTINEKTPLAPDSPYSISKAAAHFSAQTYREAYGLDVRTGILFNHESPLRNDAFVIRKITSSVAKIALGLQRNLELGNIDVERDWGYAPDYVSAIELIMGSQEPGDYVVGSGVLTSLSKVLETAFSVIGVHDWRSYVTSDDAGQRPLDHGPLIADSSKIRTELGWQPTKDFASVIAEMVEFDLRLASDPSAAKIHSAFLGNEG